MTLGQPAPIARGTPALPRVATPKTAATARINAALARLDTRWLAFQADCRNGGVNKADISVDRTVETTMRGPAYLSLVVRADYYCGGAHPDTSAIALVYDLSTGRPVDWMTLLPASLEAQASLDEAADGARMGVISSPVLHDLYIKALGGERRGADWADCAQALEEPALPFMLWPDARQGGLALQPSGLPHVVQACGEAETIPTATLRKLGVDRGLVDAIDRSHAAWTASHRAHRGR